jgi:hypothetical protein
MWVVFMQSYAPSLKGDGCQNAPPALDACRRTILEPGNKRQAW